MDISESLTEANNLIQSARLVVAAFEQDPDDYTSIKESIQELADEFKRVMSFDHATPDTAHLAVGLLL